MCNGQDFKPEEKKTEEAQQQKIDKLKKEVDKELEELRSAFDRARLSEDIEWDELKKRCINKSRHQIIDTKTTETKTVETKDFIKTIEVVTTKKIMRKR